MKLGLFGKSIQGAREYQEDYIDYLHQQDAESDKCLAVLCDGMGGHEGGAEASQLVTKTFINNFSEANSDLEPTEVLQQSLTQAHNNVIQTIQDGGPQGMGTTLVAVYIENDNLHWISVGDSHLYLYRKGELTKLNADHSLGSVLDQMADIGRISEEDALCDPQRNALRSYISDEDIRFVDVQQKNGFLKSKDILVLASDGLDSMELDDFADLIKHHKNNNSAQITEKLLNNIDNIGRVDQDNTSIIVITVQKINFIDNIINKLKK